MAASELELGVPERKEPDEGDDIQPWCTPDGPVPTDPLGMGIAVFLLAPVAADPVVAVAELAVLKSMAAYSALFSGSSISIDGTPPQLWLPPGYPTPPPSPSEQKELLLLPVDRECCLGLAPPYPVIEEEESLRMCTGGVPGVLTPLKRSSMAESGMGECEADCTAASSNTLRLSFSELSTGLIISYS